MGIYRKFSAFLLATLFLAIQGFLIGGVSPSPARPVLKLTVVADTDANKALAWL